MPESRGCGSSAALVPRLMNSRFISSIFAIRSCGNSSTAILASRSFRTPFPEIFGLGSSMPDHDSPDLPFNQSDLRARHLGMVAGGTWLQRRVDHLLPLGLHIRQFSSAVTCACSPSLCSPRYAATSLLRRPQTTTRPPTFRVSTPSSLWHFRASSTAFSMNSRSVPPPLATGRDLGLGILRPATTLPCCIGMPRIVDSQGSDDDAPPTIDEAGRPSPSIRESDRASAASQETAASGRTVSRLSRSVKEIGRINRHARTQQAPRPRRPSADSSSRRLSWAVLRASHLGIVVSPALRHSLMAMVHATVSTPSQRTRFCWRLSSPKESDKISTSCLSIGPNRPGIAAKPGGDRVPSPLGRLLPGSFGRPDTLVPSTLPSHFPVHDLLAFDDQPATSNTFSTSSP